MLNKLITCDTLAVTYPFNKNNLPRFTVQYVVQYNTHQNNKIKILHLAYNILNNLLIISTSHKYSPTH